MFTKDVRNVSNHAQLGHDMNPWIPKQWYLCKGLSFDGWSTNGTLGFNAEIFSSGDGYLLELPSVLSFVFYVGINLVNETFMKTARFQIPDLRKQVSFECFWSIITKNSGFPSLFLSSHFGKKRFGGGWIKHDFLYSIEMNQCRWARNHSHIKSHNDKQNKCQLYNLRSYNLQLSIVWSALSGEASFVNSWYEYCKWVLQFTKLKGICVLLGLEINIMFTERMKVSMVSKNERSAYTGVL